MSKNIFSKFQICLASPSEITKISYGEVTKPTTVDNLSMKPKLGGLFCARIFGPVIDYECLCGKYSGLIYKSHVCESCQVEVISSNQRRLRMGHVELNAPVSHIWFTRILPSYLGMFLDIPYEKLEFIIYNKNCDIIYSLLYAFDIVSEYIQIREYLLNKQNKHKTELYKLKVKRFKLLESFIAYKNRPEWMILINLPIIPPDLRPLIKTDKNLFISSDLNYFYATIIRRNNRLKVLLQLNISSNLIDSEKKMLQQSVDNLFDNSKSRFKIYNKKKEPLKSLSDRLGGKEGRFRHNLLGKRVDYSGRSVIISGPKLKLSQCGLPIYIILELFKPFIYSKVIPIEYVYSYKSLLRKNIRFIQYNYYFWDRFYKYIIGKLVNIIKKNPIFLNRAPTLHKLNIQSFEPVLSNTKSIQLHPIVCSSFNADFDGDQMAVHLPLSLYSQIESRILMLSYYNIISPTNNKPIISPNQDIVFGIYYATLQNNHSLNNNSMLLPIFNSIQSLQICLQTTKTLNLHSLIYCRIKRQTYNKQDYFEIIKSTIGKILLYNLIPLNYSFEYFNENFNKQKITNLIESLYFKESKKQFILTLDSLMSFGFYASYHSGISLAKENLVTPYLKKQLMVESISTFDLYKLNSTSLGTSNNKSFKNLVHNWNITTREINQLLLFDMNSQITNLLNKPLFYMLIQSGARGSINQLRQLSILKGLTTKPNGDIVEIPIISNFTEGLSVLEYFVSGHGSRKGVIDTSIRTAAAGYLTRRLISSSQDLIIRMYDCYSKKGLKIIDIKKGSDVILSLYERAKGRILARDVIDMNNGNILISRNSTITNKHINLLAKYNIHYIYVRSPLTCNLTNGICQKCYGVDNATNYPPPLGFPAGIIAAQSIGEPGTQLTMRTFHLGGIFNEGNDINMIRCSTKTKLIILNKNNIMDRYNNIYNISHNCKILLLDNNYTVIFEYNIPYGARLFFEDGQEILEYELIASWNLNKIPILSITQGYIKIISEHRYVTNNLHKFIDNKYNKSIFFYITNDRNEHVYLHNGLKAKYRLFNIMETFIYNNQKIEFGDIMAYISNKNNSLQDITAYISKVSQMFEMSTPLSNTILAKHSGYISLLNDSTNLKIMIKTPKLLYNEKYSFKNDYISPLININNIRVLDNQYIHIGEPLNFGNLNYINTFNSLGFNRFIEFFTKELQVIYRSQNVNIKDIHFECILNRMFKNVYCSENEAHSINNKFLNNELLKNNHIIENTANISNSLEINYLNSLPKGITKNSLSSYSFIAAASFQNTSKILTRSSILNEIDFLLGPQENIIIGKLIPLGTGYYVT